MCGTFYYNIESFSLKTIQNDSIEEVEMEKSVARCRNSFSKTEISLLSLLSLESHYYKKFRPNFYNAKYLFLFSDFQNVGNGWYFIPPGFGNARRDKKYQGNV